MNGIEKTWGVMKHRFRQRLTELKVKDELFDTEEIVRNIADSLTAKQIRAQANNGWRAIFYD